MSDGRALRVWLVNQYALPLGSPGITRHATLAKLMGARGVRTRIFASNEHYWKAAPTAGIEQSDESSEFVHLRTLSVDSNGAKRVASMLLFSASVLWHGLRSAPGRCSPPDVVVGSSPHPFAALSAWLLAKRYRVPFVLEVRDLWPDSLIDILGISPRHPLVVVLRMIERFLYRRAALVVALLPASRERIVDIAGRPVPTLWIPNGVDTTQLPAIRPYRPNEPFTVMYAGAHGAPNALHTLVRASAQLERGYPGRYAVRLIGGGKEKDALRVLAQEVGATNVTFTDPLPKDEVLAILPSADALAIPGLDTDLYRFGISPNKLFDYMGAARPILLCLKTPESPVEVSGCGLMVTPESADKLAEAIVALHDMSAEERAVMGSRGREFVIEHHDMQLLAQRLADALNTVAGRR